MTRPVISLMLAVPDAGAAASWYAQALGATELWNLGSVIGLSVQGAPVFLAEPENNGWEHPTALGTTTVRVEVFVDDPDGFVDPFGHPLAGRGPLTTASTPSLSAGRKSHAES